MSTIVIVKKAGKVCIAADSLTTFGDMRLSSVYDKNHDKIQVYMDSYIGIVGSAAHTLVLDSILNDNDVEVDLSSRVAIFETFRNLHPVLKEKYFLNSKDEDNDPYESTQIDGLIINPNGMFGIHSLREVSEYKKFWAIGSGSEYALGAMFATYDRFETAEEIARLGVEAGAEFNNASSLPMSLYTVDLANPSADDR